MPFIKFHEKKFRNIFLEKWHDPDFQVKTDRQDRTGQDRTGQDRTDRRTDRQSKGYT